jgi:hypothetical protein
MGALTVANTLNLDPLIARVHLRGRRRSDVFCTSIQPGLGTAGTRAVLVLPSAMWDGTKTWLRGIPVEVEAGYPASGTSTVFAGYVTRVTGQISDNMIALEAASLLAALGDRVHVGQGIAGGDLVAEYPQRMLRGGVMTATGWTAKEILRDFFSSRPKTWRGGGGSLPSDWRARIELGSLSVLSSSWNNFPVGDQIFNQATLRQALDTLLQTLGMVTFAEEFLPGGGVRLRFFELGDPAAPRRRVIVARPGESAAGSNVLNISEEESVDEVSNRIIAMGGPRRYVVSIASNHATAPLAKDWNPALEAAVLANPEGTKRGKESGKAGDQTRTEFSEEKGRVFRWWKLPDVLRRYVVQRENALETADGRAVALQAWKFGRDVTYDPETQALGSTPAAEPTLIEGVEWDLENWRFQLPAPAINFVGGLVDGSNNIVDTYEGAVVGVTLTVQGERLIHDTGAAGGTLDFDGVDASGLSDVIVNDSFDYVQATNIDAPLVDADGEEHVYGDTWIFEAGTGWRRFTTKTVLKDLSGDLQFFGDAAQRERMDVRRTYNVTTPFFTRAFRLGDRVEIVGADGFDYGTHQIRSLSLDLTHSHAVTFGTDTQVPLVVAEILSSSDAGSAQLPPARRPAERRINPAFESIMREQAREKLAAARRAAVAGMDFRTKDQRELDQVREVNAHRQRMRDEFQQASGIPAVPAPHVPKNAAAAAAARDRDFGVGQGRKHRPTEFERRDKVAAEAEQRGAAESVPDEAEVIRHRTRMRDEFADAMGTPKAPAAGGPNAARATRDEKRRVKKGQKSDG